MNHGSLFSGIGGFDLAAEWMGWDNKFHCDINPFSRKLCNFYWPEAESYDNIKTTDFTIWRGRIDILSGGFPCQPFSHAGKRMGKEDERHLWPEFHRAIREIRPRYVVGENVRGILSWSDGLVLEEVYADLEGEGYEVQTFVLPAVGINAPHKRDRVYIVAKDTSSDGCLQRESIQEGTGFRELRDTSARSSNGVHIQEGCAADTNDSRDRNSLRVDEDRSKEMSQRRQSFSELRQNGINGDVTNTTSIGLHRQEHEQELGIKRGNQFQFGKSENKRNATDTNSWGLEGSIEIGRNSEYVERKSDIGITADTECLRLELGQDATDLHRLGSQTQGERNQSAVNITPDDNVHSEQGGPSEIWDGFPIKSPLCWGDDGLPTELDGLALPKWRKESIMGYGNAIVPQIAYRIFATIDEIENRS
jgi:DNA (cytosine-5)-methyltransferase 1